MIEVTRLDTNPTLEVLCDFADELPSKIYRTRKKINNHPAKIDKLKRYLRKAKRICKKQPTPENMQAKNELHKEIQASRKKMLEMRTGLKVLEKIQENTLTEIDLKSQYETNHPDQLI